MNDDARLAEIHDDVKAILERRLPGIENRLTRIETLHSMWGAIAGFVAGLIATFFSRIRF